MIDLHLHLDGSLLPELVWELAKEQGEEISLKQVEETLTAPPNCADLNEYLRCFALPAQVMQSGEALCRCGHELACRLAREGVLYGEIRFAPCLHTRKGLTQAQAVEAVWKGVKRAMGNHPDFSAQLILCCMRGGGEEENRETVYTASQYMGSGVCACDLAGAEAIYPTKQYGKLFAYAKALEVPFTIHAGEADGPESIWDALSFGASRIGHGVRAAEDSALLQELAEKKIPLELCYTSNLQTKAVSSPARFPLRDFLQRGIVATLNTDNMTVSGVTLEGEYKKLGLTEEEKKTLLRNSVQASFLSSERKEELWKRIQIACKADR